MYRHYHCQINLGPSVRTIAAADVAAVVVVAAVQFHTHEVARRNQRCFIQVDMLV